MQVWLVWVAMPVVVVLAVGLGRLLWRRQRAESGWTAWSRTASGLSWRDRVVLLWSTSTGRAVQDPRLAELAVERAERGAALIDAVSVRQKWILRVLAVLELVVAVLFAVAGSWVQAGIFLAVAIGMACMPAIVRADRRRAQRSAAANRALID